MRASRRAPRQRPGDSARPLTPQAHQHPNRHPATPQTTVPPKESWIRWSLFSCMNLFAIHALILDRLWSPHITSFCSRDVRYCPRATKWMFLGPCFGLWTCTNNYLLNRSYWRCSSCSTSPKLNCPPLNSPLLFVVHPWYKLKNGP